MDNIDDSIQQTDGVVGGVGQQNQDPTVAALLDGVPSLTPKMAVLESKRADKPSHTPAASFSEWDRQHSDFISVESGLSSQRSCGGAP